MRALILAAGKGERMRPLTLFKPKPLLEVGNKPLIEYHIERLKAAGIDDIVINTSWLAQQIFDHLGNGERLGVRLRYSYEGDEPLETGGGIFHALLLLGNEPFLVVNGDTWHDIDFASLSLTDGDWLNLVMVDNPPHNPDGDFILTDGRLHKPKTNVPALTYSGVGVFHPDLFADSQPGRWPLAPLIRHAVASSRAAGIHHSGYWQDIGTVERLLQANQQFKREHQT